MRRPIGLVLALVLTAQKAEAESLRVCADPNNLPFSNSAGEGFENRIATLVAEKLGRTVEFVWRAQRRGFLREGPGPEQAQLGRDPLARCLPLRKGVL